MRHGLRTLAQFCPDRGFVGSVGGKTDDGPGRADRPGKINHSDRKDCLISQGLEITVQSPESSGFEQT